jgi:hypothetical protein
MSFHPGRRWGVARNEVDHRIDLRFGSAFTLLTVGLLGGSVGWIWSVRHRLPDPIARHWSGGQADGFSELPAVLLLSVALPLVVGPDGRRPHARSHP